MKEYDSLSDNEKRNMLSSVANLYYNAEMTQNQIAERFFTSRSKICVERCQSDFCQRSK